MRIAEVSPTSAARRRGLHRLLTWLHLLAAVAVVSSCGSRSSPSAALAQARQAIGKAQRAGAAARAEPAYYLSLARQELDEGRRLLDRKELDRASLLLERAAADADLARVLAETDELVGEARTERRRLQQLRAERARLSRQVKLQR